MTCLYKFVGVKYCFSLCRVRSSTNNLPCFLFETLLQPSEAFDLLLNLSPDHPDVASSKPIGVVKPATFVVANTAVGKLDDLKADDVGVWESQLEATECPGCHLERFMVQK